MGSTAPTADGQVARREPYRDVVARLAAAQKRSRNAPAYSRWVNRPLGRRIAAAAYLLGLTPDAVTGISALLTFSGIALVALVAPVPWLGPVVALLLVAGYAFDAADGQLARLRGGGSLLGEWLDHVVDAFKNVLVHMAVLVSWYRFGPGTYEGDVWLLVPVAFAVVSSVFFLAFILTDQLRRLHGTGRPDMTSAEGVAQRAPLMSSLMTLPNDYGLLSVSFVTFGLAAVFPPLYALLLAANVAFLAVGLARWSRELRNADRAAGRR